jgi:hypothetical protein
MTPLSNRCAAALIWLPIFFSLCLAQEDPLAAKGRGLRAAPGEALAAARHDTAANAGESGGKARIMVIIEENNVRTAGPGNQTAETTIFRFLKDPYGFELIDPKVAASIRASRQKMAALAAGDSAAAAIAREAGADALITGTAISSEMTRGRRDPGGMTSVRAEVTLKALNCKSGSVIGGSSVHAFKVHINPATAGNQAIAQASRKAIENLVDPVIKGLQIPQNGDVTLNVVVKGVTTVRQRNDIVLSLEALCGLKAVRERFWDVRAKALTMDIDFTGNAPGFCILVEGYKMKSGGGSLSVSGVNGNSVTLIARAM